MRFLLIDQIHELVRGEKIVASKSLSLAEEYLADHFPKFPVLPGVFMVEAMSQSATWLMREEEDFAHSAVMLKSARNIKYSGFVSPGDTLRLQATVVKSEGNETTFKVSGHVGEKQCVSGRIVLEKFNLADTDPIQKPRDDYARDEARDQFILLRGPEAVAKSKAEAVAAS